MFEKSKKKTGLAPATFGAPSACEAAIPDGRKVWFVRGFHDPKVHVARVLASSKLYGGGNHYVISCPTFPYVIGFAHDEELFRTPEQAQVEADVWARKARDQRIQDLKDRRQDVERELELELMAA